MPVIINYKICDNSKDCNAIRVCPTGAFTWNDKKKTLEVDENKCIGCGLCATSEESCSVGAIKFAKTEEEYKKIKKEIDDDPRTIADLMVDRYGAEPINMPFYCTEENLPRVLNTPKTCLIEVFNDDSIECLIKSIPVKEILNKTLNDALYRKVLVETDAFKEKFNIKEFPSILVIKDNKLLGKVEGYYTVDQKEEFINKIRELI